MRRKILLAFTSLTSLQAMCEARFPKPDFTSGYQYPDIEHGVPMEWLWNIFDILLLIIMMGVVIWAAYKRRNRSVILGVSVVSVAWFGFFRSGCVCSVGSIQNVVLSLVDPTYHLPWYVLLIFIIPLLVAVLFGRVFCAGVCPLGALQELVNVKNFRISRAVTAAMSVIPWIYLAFTILYAATRSQFLICRFDPFVSIFRLGGDLGMLIFGVALLLLSVFIGRPFCQFFCPYGALLSVFSTFAWKKLTITSKTCINCALCNKSCPVDAIYPPQDSKTKETRTTGVRRIILFVAMLPVFTLGGTLLIGQQSNALSRAHKSVYLYKLIQEQKANPEMEMPLEVETFHALGGNIAKLESEVTEVQHQYSIYAHLAGALIGFVIGFKLLRLSVKRSRKTYEIDTARCTLCGRCFSYCPQNKNLTN